MIQNAPTVRTRGVARAFSLVELLTVIAIIAILIGILIPALANVQTSGRVASTQARLTELNAAAASFELDNRRPPGYFSATVLGSQTNFNNGAGAGLTVLENALLDLAGSDAVFIPSDDAPTPPGSQADWVLVNPTDAGNGVNGNEVWVKADLIGAGEGDYFKPPAGALVHMDAVQQPGLVTNNQPQTGALPDGLPDLVDAWGQPILAWMPDPAGPRLIREGHDFAGPSVEDHRALFYWASNGSMLSSPRLGQQGEDMTRAPSLNGGSLIGQGALQLGEEQIEGVMAALLGHPGYPDEALLAARNYSDIVPLRPRGSFIAHSAGKDGIFLSSSDDRAGQVLSTDMLGAGNLNITYGVNFFNDVNGTRRVDEDGQPTTRSFLEGFDDVVITQ